MMEAANKSGSRGIGSVLRWIASLVALAALCLVAYAYSGLYNIGADSPHIRPVYWLLETTRDRSVAAHADSVLAPPDLDEQERISSGAGLYAEMCAECHLAPGMEETEIAQGLYPAPPDFAHGNDLSPQEQFWVIKHGIKASGMAAWGKTHNDALIWDMVAFLRRIGTLSPEQYQDLVKSAPEDHDEMMEHQDTDDGHAGHEH